MLLALLAALALPVLAPAPAAAIDASIHLERARQAYTAGKYEDALAEYDAMLKLLGEDAAVRNNRALCYLALSQLDRARWESERAIELAPAEGQFYITLAVIQLTLKPADLKGARENLITSIKYLKRARDHAGVANACYNLGVIAQRRRKYEEASSWYRQALYYDPSNMDARDALRGIDPESGG
ncbi:MAG: tetratricopeptide repeat protein [Candidatus Coatesbacteria bacterium]